MWSSGPLAYRLAAFLFAFSVLAGTALAASNPGVPGKSGNNNPHGGPPGQGGPVPGQSGEHNPHGSPPGQRMGVGNPFHGGDTTMPGGGAGSILGRSGAMLPERHYPGGPCIVPERAAALAKKAVGWEPDWMYLADAFGEVRVTSRLVERNRPARETLLLRKNGRRLLRTAAPVIVTQLLIPPVLWVQRAGGAWVELSGEIRQADVVVMRFLEDPVRRMTTFWDATPWDVGTAPGGRKTLLLRVHAGGALEMEVEGSDYTVTRVSFSGSGAEPGWTEERRVVLMQGRAALLERRRVYPGGAEHEVTEKLDWLAGPGSVSDLEVSLR